MVWDWFFGLLLLVLIDKKKKVIQKMHFLLQFVFFSVYYYHNQVRYLLFFFFSIMSKAIYITFDYREQFVTVSWDTFNSKETIKAHWFQRASKASKRYKEITSKEEGIALCDAVAKSFNVSCEEKNIINTQNYYYQAKVDTSVKKVYNNQYNVSTSDLKEVDSYAYALATA